MICPASDTENKNYHFLHERELSIESSRTPVVMRVEWQTGGNRRFVMHARFQTSILFDIIL
jgi:hypothetical protein